MLVMFLKFKMALQFIKEASKQIYGYLAGYGTAKLFGGETEKPSQIIVQPKIDAPANKEEKYTTSEIITFALILLSLGIIIVAIKSYVKKLIASAQKSNSPRIQYITNATPTNTHGINLNA